MRGIPGCSNVCRPAVSSFRSVGSNVYLTSPVWRFAIAEGVCGSGAYAGVMVPSVDRVGRYFPLTLAVQLNTEDCLLELASEAARNWFDAAEALLLSALEAHDLDLTWFDEQVLALGSPLGEADAAGVGPAAGSNAADIARRINRLRGRCPCRAYIRCSGP